MITDRRKIVVYSFVVGIGFDLLWRSLWWLYKQFRCNALASSRRYAVKAIFFPDSEVSCRNHFTQRHGCTNQRCRFSHNPDNAYAQLLKHIQLARRSIDLCVFSITCADLVEVVIRLNHMGVAVRVITDNEQVDATGSQIGRFRMEGIQVRHDYSSYYMHHKFVVIDGQLLITGSFNWTRQAVVGNNENLIITDHGDLVSAYRQEFDRLWQTFDPKHYLVPHVESQTNYR